MKLPEGTLNQHTFRLKGKGVPAAATGAQGSQSHAGDLLATVNIETPQHLTSEQKSLLQAVAKSLTPQQLPQRETMWRLHSADVKRA